VSLQYKLYLFDLSWTVVHLFWFVVTTIHNKLKQVEFELL